jgi:hypothetical protein
MELFMFPLMLIGGLIPLVLQVVLLLCRAGVLIQAQPLISTAGLHKC